MNSREKPEEMADWMYRRRGNRQGEAGKGASGAAKTRWVAGFPAKNRCSILSRRATRETATPFTVPLRKEWRLSPKEPPSPKASWLWR